MRSVFISSHCKLALCSASERVLDSSRANRNYYTDKIITSMKCFFTPASLALVAIIVGPGRKCDARMTPLFLETPGARISNRNSDAEKAAPHAIRRLKDQHQAQNHRDLQTCEALLAELPGLESPEYCTCQAPFGTSTFDVICDYDCSVCEGGFGTSFLQMCASFETQFFLTRNGDVVSNVDCVQYTLGRTERLCLEYAGTSSCTVKLDGTACSSCEWTVCEFGSMKPLVDCSNIVAGATAWNTCSNNVQIPLSSPFAPLSGSFFPVDECYSQLPEQEQLIEATPPPSRAPIMEDTPQPSRAPVIMVPVDDNGNGNVLDDTSLRVAVDLWFSDRTTAIESYGPIGDWDVSSVSTMERLFQNVEEFNDNISRWNTSNVNTMNSMFQGATSFNQPLSSWNTSTVTDMEFMFDGATSFNQPLSSWDTGRVEIMSYMFQRATSFNQPLSSWNTSSVTNMRLMFQGATSFNQPLSSWNTSNVTNMSFMFYEATTFNEHLTWDTGRVIIMAYMFFGARNFNQDLDWDTSNVVFFQNMFEGALAFNGDLREWDTSSARFMTRMFYNADSFAQELCWDLSLVGTASMMLCSTQASLDPSCTPSDILEMVRCEGGDPSPAPSPVVAPTAVPTLRPTPGDTTQATPPPSRAPVMVNDNGNGNVLDDTSLRVAVDLWFSDRATAIESYGPIGDWDVSSVSNMERLFQNEEEFNDNISRWNTSNVNSMEFMFSGATLFNQPLASWDTSRVESMSSMFERATSFDQPLSGWNTPNVTTMSFMFWKATAFNQHLTWDTGRVNNMAYMFLGAQNFNQDLDWDTSNLVFFSHMFESALAFNGDLREWDTSNGVYFDSMFESALAFNGDLREWDTSSAQFMTRMFYNADSFAQELCWDLSQVETVSEMLCSTPASLDPSCASANVLTLARCNGRDPSPTPSPVAAPTGPTGPSGNTRGSGDDDPALATGVVFAIVLASFIVAVILILQYCRWQLGRVGELEGSSTVPRKDVNSSTQS
jgi:surface protein